ncbi:MAG: hypothetical protein KGL35_21635 [Bradyrhizobium sp.]|nr:hypothetical protein [Bradyrhizobium sp.]
MSFPIDFGALVSGEGGLTATGSTQATALPLTRQVSVFASVPAGAGTILPSSYAAGTRLTVVNRDASNTLSIYPASGDEIESLGINNAFTLSPGGDATFISFAPPLAPAPRQWFQVNTLSAAPTITGGTINGATIGLTTPAAGAFTSLTANSATGNAQINAVVSTAQNPFTFTAALNATPTGNPSAVVGLYGEADGNASTNLWELLGVVGVSYLEAPGTGWVSVQAGQFLPIMATGSSAQYKYGIQIALVSQDQINASVENTALLIEATTNWTGVGWTTGISFGGRQGWWPMDATATLIGTNPPAAGGRAYDAESGIDFSSVTFSTAFLKSNGYLVDGSGNETVLTTTTHTYTVATLPAAGTKGRRAFVSDATATTFGTVVVGGGANNVPVFDNGTNWVIG